jgi:hypothetical protein
VIEASFVIALCGAFYWLGWRHRDNWDWIRAKWLETAHPDVSGDKPKSMILEPKPETPSERAKREQDELLESMNP